MLQALCALLVIIVLLGVGAAALWLPVRRALIESDKDR